MLEWVRGGDVGRAGPSRAEGPGALVVAVAAAALYAASLRNGFAYDDVSIVAGDPRVLALDLSGILNGPYWPGFGYYRPLTTLSYAVDWAVSGGAPAWFHLTNVLLHVAASLLVLLLLREFFRPGAALAGALIFAAHPVHVEAVANVVGRGELLAAVFFLGGCVVWARNGRDPDGRPSVPATAALFALALASKEGSAVFPAVLVLLDAALGRLSPTPTGIRDFLRRRGLALATVSAVLPVYLLVRLAVLGHFAPPVVHPAAEVLTERMDLLRTALQAWPVYLRLMVFPATLLIDYGPQVIMPATEWTPGAAFGLLLLAASLGGGAVALLRGHRRWGFALLWFVVTVLPVSNLLVTTGIFVAERTLYVPSLAVSFAIAGVVNHRWSIAPARLHRAALAFSAIAVVLFGLRTIRRVPEWKSTETAFAALVRDRPDAYRGAWYEGRKARMAGDLDGASVWYERAIRLWPHRQALFVEAVGTEVLRNRPGDARRLAEEAVRRWPENVEALRLFAALALDMGDSATARPAIEAGLRLAPDDSLFRSMRRAITQDQAGEDGS